MFSEKKIAIFSPSQHAYSETFIQAHKKLNHSIQYYYGGLLPRFLEGDNSFHSPSFIKRIQKKFHYRFSLTEYKLISSLKDFSIEVVLAEYGTCGATVYPLCQELGIPLVVHFHGYDASMFEILENYAAAYIKMFAYASAIISVSQAMTDRLKEMGCPAEKIVYNPYGPADDFFALKPDLNAGYFLSVGRFVEKKAPHLTILAFKKFQEKYPQARLTMVGSGPLLGTCQWLAESIGANIHFAGDLPHDQLRSVFEQACCFVQHSVVAKNGDREGTPVGILEACAAGLPVISTRHEGISDVIQEGSTGLLVNEGDIDGMQAGMETIFLNQALRQSFGSAGRAFVQANFSMEKHITALNKVIAAAAKQRQVRVL